VSAVIAQMRAAGECLEASNSARDIRAGIALAEARGKVAELVASGAQLLLLVSLDPELARNPVVAGFSAALEAVAG
jgi:hypothetical protein